MNQTRPLPPPSLQELVEAARPGGEIERITPELFREIHAIVSAGAPEYSKIEKDAFAMLAAGVIDQYRAAHSKRPSHKNKERG